MDSLGIDRWTHVCHDLGGFWTWEMIDCQPHRIEKLVILNTTAYEDGFRPKRAPLVGAMKGPLGPPLLRLASDPHSGPSAIKFALRRFIGDRHLLTAPVVAGYWLPFHEGTGYPLRVFAQSLESHITQFPRYSCALRRSGIPAMLIWGAGDPVMDVRKLPQQFAADLCIPPERVVILPHAGHLLMEDEPFIVSEHIAEFAWTPAHVFISDPVNVVHD
jgi:pimeloyl-ACP methyl ester carboxylesterase